MVIITINSLLELVGLAAILPLLAAILKEGFIQENTILNQLFNALSFESEKSFIAFLSMLILVMMILKNMFSLWVHRMQMNFTWEAYESLSDDTLYSVYNKGFLYFSSQNSNKVLNKVVGIPLQYAQMLLLHIFLFFNELVILCFVLVSLLIYDYKILLTLAGVVTPVFLLFYTLNKKRIGALYKRLNDLGPKRVKPVFETIFGYVDVAIGGVFNHFRKEYIQHVVESRKIWTRLGVIQQIPNKLVELSVILAVVIMLLYGVYVLDSPEKIISLLSVFALAAYRSIPSINRLMIAVVNIKGQAYVLDELAEFLPIERLSNTKQEPLTFDHQIEVKGLSFRYPEGDKDIVNNFDLNIKKGESIGIVGKSGSGKTTIMNILLGFIRPTGGSINIDGKALSPNNLKAWQRKIGYVRQDVFLIDGSVEDNIAFGVPKSSIDRKKLEEVVKKAQLVEFVDNLPEGIDSNIGERGSKISGGQRQRIGIARALYHDAEILFFDEATSALDNETEQEITDAIRSIHSEDLTMIIIAHRTSTLQYCDRIINVSPDDIRN